MAPDFNSGMLLSFYAVDVLQNEYSQRQTASLVSFGPKQRILGESARLKQVTNFRDTIGSLKRLIGRKFADPEVQVRMETSPIDGLVHSFKPSFDTG